MLIDWSVLFGKLVTNCWKPVLSTLNPFGIEVVLSKVPLDVYIFIVALICLPTVAASETEYVVVNFICWTFLPGGKKIDHHLTSVLFLYHEMQIVVGLQLKEKMLTTTSRTMFLLLLIFLFQPIQISHLFSH